MEVARIVKKLTSYLLIAGGATIFTYLVFTAGIYPYPLGEKSLTEAALTQYVYLPLGLSVLGLIVMLVAEYVLFKSTDNSNSMRILGIALTAYFGALILASVLFLVYVGKRNASIAMVSTIPVFAVAAVEVVIGIKTILTARKMKSDEDLQGNSEK
ncbi:MAG: hypothetical protein K5694_06315 [Bacilli bacterium]|nr:hypothetical protein [Bacilli bacterium]